jgi:outer membrane immunogenic protein
MAGAPAGSYKDAPYSHDANQSWSGLYIGVAIGYSYSTNDLTHDWTNTVPAAVRDRYGLDQDGVIGSIGAGFDRQLGGGFVWGLFGDYTIGTIKDEVTLATPGNVDLRFKLRDSWAAGGRLGIVHYGGLWYVAAGYTGIKVSLDDLDDTLHGYFIGAGLEKDIHPNFRMKLEYRYSDYGSGTLFSSAGCCAERLDIETSTHSFRLGMSYVFRHEEAARHEPYK